MNKILILLVCSLGLLSCVDQKVKTGTFFQGSRQNFSSGGGAQNDKQTFRIFRSEKFNFSIKYPDFSFVPWNKEDVWEKVFVIESENEVQILTETGAFAKMDIKVYELETIEKLAEFIASGKFGSACNMVATENEKNKKILNIKIINSEDKSKELPRRLCPLNAYRAYYNKENGSFYYIYLGQESIFYKDRKGNSYDNEMLDSIEFFQ